MKSPLGPENLEKLFLFELYVESLKIDYTKLYLTKKFLDAMKETTIHFQFLGFKPVEIKEEEFAKIPEQADCGERKVMTGKSCLFSLRDMPREIGCFEMSLSVTRRTEPGGRVDLGGASIKLGEKFANIFKTPKPKLLSASVKKPFTLFDKSCKEVGTITLSINLSCFGKIITTSFQLDGEDSKAYVVKPGGDVTTNELHDKSEESQEKGVCLGDSFGRLLGGHGFRQEARMSPEYGQQYAMKTVVQHGLWMGERQGLLGGMPGAALPQERKQQESREKAAVCVESSSSSEEERRYAPLMPNLQLCSCNIPVPSMFLQPPLPPRKKKKKKKKPCNFGMMKDFCMNLGCPMGYPNLPVIIERHQVCQKMEVPPGVFGLKGEQMFFQIPSDTQPIPGNRKATFNFGGGTDKNLSDIRIMTDGEMKQCSLPTRCNDVYVMKVGKTNKETDQRNKMVLEIKQPRLIKEEKIVCDIRTQYVEADFVPEQPKKKEVGKKGGKEGGKKGGKEGGKKGK